MICGRLHSELKDRITVVPFFGFVPRFSFFCTFSAITPSTIPVNKKCIVSYIPTMQYILRKDLQHLLKQLNIEIVTKLVYVGKNTKQLVITAEELKRIIQEIVLYDGMNSDDHQRREYERRYPANCRTITKYIQFTFSVVCQDKDT